MAIKAGVPIKICGIWITPKWDWTPWYRKSYGKTLRGDLQDEGIRAGPTACVKQENRLSDMADKYSKWLDEKRKSEHREKRGKK